MSGISFTKMVGAGNDFIVVDARRRHPARRWPQVARALCDRHAGIGADGLLVLERSRRAAARMRVFNPDGSEAEMCGNGARCVAQYLAGAGRSVRAQEIAIDTLAGMVTATVRGERVATRLTDPVELQLGLGLELDGRTVRLGFVNTGVPHAVVPVPAVDEVDVARLGRALRGHAAFAPRGANVNFVQPDPAHPGRVRVRTYERGVEGETLACGTGVAATAVIYGLTQGRTVTNGQPAAYRVAVQVRSGDVLTVSFQARQVGGRLQVGALVLEGLAREVFTGAAAWPLHARA